MVNCLRYHPRGEWLFAVGGVLGIAAGVVAFLWPGITLLALAIFVAWYLVVSGIFTVVVNCVTSLPATRTLTRR